MLNIHGSKLILCIWWDQLDVVYYDLFQPNKSVNGVEEFSLKNFRALLF